MLPIDGRAINNESIQYLEDSSSVFKIEDILAFSENSEYRFISAESADIVPKIGTYWIKFSVENQNDFDGEWLFDFESWSDVKFYTVSDNIVEKELITGHLVPFVDRHYPMGNMNHLLLPVYSAERINCIVRLEFIEDHLIVPTNLNFSIGERSVIDAHNGRVKQIISVFIGILIFIFIYHLFVYLSTRNISYVYYLVIVAATLYMTLSNSGYVIEVFQSMESFPRWRGMFEAIGSGLTAVMMIMFTMQILQTKDNIPFWHKVMRWFIWIVIILTIGNNISFKVFGPLILLTTFLLMAVFITVGIIAVRKRLPSGGYYLLAYSFSVVGIFILFSMLSGAIPKTDFNAHYAMPLGYTLEMVFYSLALANVINVLKKENYAGQQQIIAQLKENQELQTKVNRELESKVQERTQEIRKQSEIIVAEKEKADELLLNILPAETAEELKAKGKATTKSFAKASVLFTDFENFTQICENMTPDEIVGNLDACFRAFDDIAVELNLEKIKTIGDSYMCAEGIPDHSKTTPSNIVEAGLRMQEFIKTWNEKKKAQGEAVWPMRVGINSGPITAGVVGKKKFAYDIWGDTVNLAARMESASDVGKVNLSEFTRDLVKDQFKFTSRGKLPAKNYGDVDMYFADRL